jgi:hypothetical protein
MLERNRLQPPRSATPPDSNPGFDGAVAGLAGLFASAEDYDSTGILTGVDPCESRYWWMPELYATPASLLAGTSAATEAQEPSASRPAGTTAAGLLGRLLRTGQATQRTTSRTTAAA